MEIYWAHLGRLEAILKEKSAFLVNGGNVISHHDNIRSRKIGPAPLALPLKIYLFRSVDNHLQEREFLTEALLKTGLRTSHPSHLKFTKGDFVPTSSLTTTKGTK